MLILVEVGGYDPATGVTCFKAASIEAYFFGDKIVISIYIREGSLFFIADELYLGDYAVGTGSSDRVSGLTVFFDRWIDLGSERCYSRSLDALFDFISPCMKINSVS